MTDLADEIADMKRRLEEHDKLLTSGDEQFRLILQCLNDNTHAIEKLNRSTSGVVQAFQDVQGAARVGSAVWNFAVWCIKFGGALAVVGYAINWVVEHFKQGPPGG